MIKRLNDEELAAAREAVEQWSEAMMAHLEREEQNKSAEQLRRERDEARLELETEQREWQSLVVALERQRDEARAALQWSSEPPTEAGWYWWRKGVGVRQQVVRVCETHWSDGALLTSMADGDGDPEYRYTDLMDGEWAGPLAPPQEVTGA